MAGLPASIGNTVLVDVGFVLRFEWYVLAFAGSAVRTTRLYFGLKTTDFGETQAGAPDPNFYDASGGHAKRDDVAIIGFPSLFKLANDSFGPNHLISYPLRDLDIDFVSLRLDQRLPAQENLAREIDVIDWLSS
jgi:hypothetical protein